MLGTAGGALATVLTALRTHKQAQRDAALAEMQRIIDWQSGQITRLGELIDEYRQATDDLHAEHALCNAELGEVYVWLGRFHDTCVLYAEHLRAKGMDPGPVPAPPVRRSTLGRSDFVHRTAQQDATLAKHLNQSPPATGS